jgi:uncharacterized repeat protein (TIGR01451 family)
MAGADPRIGHHLWKEQLVRTNPLTTTASRIREVRDRAVSAFVVVAVSACYACAAAEVLDPNADPVDVALVATAASPIAGAGQQVTFTVAVENLGSTAAGSLVVQDTLAAGLTFLSGTPSFGDYDVRTRRWDIGTLGASDRVTLLIRAQVDGTIGQVTGFGARIIQAQAPDPDTLNNLDSAVVTVGAPPPPVTFSSQWNAELGNTRNAINDGGIWDRMIECNGGIFNIMSVIGGTSVGWTRTPNVLRIQQRGSTACGNIERTQNTVAASTTHWGRFYFRNDETANGHWHPVTYNCCGQIQMVPWLRFGSSTGVKIGVGTARDENGTQLGYPYSLWFPGDSPGSGSRQLQNGRWYRYEWELRYITATSYRIYPRIYEVDGTVPLYDYRTFYQNDNSGGGSSKSLATWYEVDNRAFGITDPTLARNFGFGNEGPGGSTSSLGYWYIADFSLSTIGWIGQ